MPGGGARITLSSNGCATVDVAAHEMGMGTATTQTMAAAERLGLAMECVGVNYGDSDFAGSFLAGGSSQTASIGASVIAAHRELVRQLLELAGEKSPLHGLSPDEIVSRDGGLCKVDDPRQWESYAAILAHAKRNEV